VVVPYLITRIDAFFELLPEKSGLQPTEIMFLVDGMRPDLYDEDDLPEASSSYFGIHREYFKRIAVRKGYNLLDMQPKFMTDYKLHTKSKLCDRKGKQSPSPSISTLGPG